MTCRKLFLSERTRTDGQCRKISTGILAISTTSNTLSRYSLLSWNVWKYPLSRRSSESRDDLMARKQFRNLVNAVFEKLSYPFKTTFKNGKREVKKNIIYTFPVFCEFVCLLNDLPWFDLLPLSWKFWPFQLGLTKLKDFTKYEIFSENTLPQRTNLIVDSLAFENTKYRISQSSPLFRQSF